MTLPTEDFITGDEFNLLRKLINKKFGIVLKGDKRLTFHARVSHRLSILGLKSYSDYYNFIISDISGEELYMLASHVTNNETYFFREKSQLDVFSEILREVKKEKQAKNEKTLKILSLACSTGEEAYSLNITVQESGLFLWEWDTKVIGIDIDKAALKKAREASYTQNSFRSNGNINAVNKYFNTDGRRYNLKKAYAKNVEFRHGNLLERSTFSGISGIDVIFCRNALIYMDGKAIEKIAENFFNTISDSGYLFIGSAESLIQRTNLFFPEYKNGIIVYRKNVQD